jgi:hypothetical protein
VSDNVEKRFETDVYGLILALIWKLYMDWKDTLEIHLLAFLLPIIIFTPFMRGK